MNPDQLDALKKMNESRMGIYEHHGWHQNFVRLRELITDREYFCHVGSGYRGQTVNSGMSVSSRRYCLSLPRITLRSRRLMF